MENSILQKAEESNNIELEYKYFANDIKYKDFTKLIKSFSESCPEQTVSSWDNYYVKPGQFARHRDSSHPELTIKSKVSANNSWKRIEVDLKLEAGLNQRDNVGQFLSLQGYERSFSIYKTSSIFYLDDVNYCYYVVYDEGLRELGRINEVEVNKNKDGELNARPGGAMAILARAEARLSELEIGPKNRMRRSLFEIYNKNEVYDVK